MKFLYTNKPLVDRRAAEFLASQKVRLRSVNRWSDITLDMLIPFVTGGKTIRGSLVLYAYSLFSRTTPSYVLDLAAAIELFQSGFLIHDDIMDNDDMRRGALSIHKQFEVLALKGSDARRFGRSMAINAADLCFFLAYELLGTLPTKYQYLTHLLSREYASVVVAQMQDVSTTHIPVTMTQKDIISLYTHKTARYSFSLPLCAGALLAQASEETSEALVTLGEFMGILFQIRDDELGASGNPRITGKPQGTDEKNKKQTLASILSSDGLSAYKRQLVHDAQRIIGSVAISPTQKNELVQLLSFCQNREN